PADPGIDRSATLTCSSFGPISGARVSRNPCLATGRGRWFIGGRPAAATMWRYCRTSGSSDIMTSTNTVHLAGPALRHATAVPYNSASRCWTAVAPPPMCRNGGDDADDFLAGSRRSTAAPPVVASHRRAPAALGLARHGGHGG